jgi:hypothetical protein
MTEHHQAKRKQTHGNPMQRLAARLADHLPFLQPKPIETLSTLFQRDTGKPAAKWQGYLQHYDRHFAKLKDQPLRILEIGVQAGGSLEVWAQYFKSATLIIGCDIDPACGALQYDDPRIKVLIGDINTPGTLQSLATLTDTLDVVIDDGSHHSSDTIRSFVQLFPRLSEEGTYLIEDLHCSYWESYGGGLYDPFSAIAFFKKIVDLVNRPVWGVDVDVKDFLAVFSAILGDASPENAMTETDWRFLEDIHSIEFVNSICVIHKRAASHNVLGPLVLSGTPSPHQYVAAEMSVLDQSASIFSSPSSQQGDTQLLHAREEIARLKEQNISLTTQNYELTKLKIENINLTSQFYEATKKFSDASVTIQQLEFKLKQLEKPNADES